MRQKFAFVVFLPLAAIVAKAIIWERCFHQGAGSSVLIWDAPVIAVLSWFAWLIRRGWSVELLVVACCFYTAELVTPLPELVHNTWSKGSPPINIKVQYIDLLGGYHAGNILVTLATFVLMLAAFGMSAIMPKEIKNLNSANEPNQLLEPTLASGTSPAEQEPRHR
jgi:hypothetical protein